MKASLATLSPLAPYTDLAGNAYQFYLSFSSGISLTITTASTLLGILSGLLTANVTIVNLEYA